MVIVWLLFGSIWFLCPLRWAIDGNYRGNILAFGFFADRGRAATFVQAKISLWGRTCDGQALFLFRASKKKNHRPSGFLRYNQMSIEQW